MEKQEQQSTTIKRRGRNWRARYLTKEEFNTFLLNDWEHLCGKIITMATDIAWLKKIGVGIFLAIAAMAIKIIVG